MHSSFLECTQKCSVLWRQHFLKWAAATTAPAGASTLPPPQKKKKNLEREGEMRVGGKSAKSAKLRNVFSLKQVCLKGLGRWRREREGGIRSDQTRWLNGCTVLQVLEEREGGYITWGVDTYSGWRHYLAAGLANRSLSASCESFCLKSLFLCLSPGRLRNS